MNTAKHTPGPWTVAAGRVITTRSGQFYITYGKDKHDNPLFRDFVELDNNARLIAAAPDLYEALHDAYYALQYARPDKFDDKEHEQFWDARTKQIHQALLKAEGKS